jgi:hypothetical protein
MEPNVSFEEQRLPFSKANFESLALAVGQLLHGLAKDCPDATSNSIGNNETKLTFTRSIKALTRPSGPDLNRDGSICQNSSTALRNQIV